MTTYPQALAKLALLHQEHLLKHWTQLSSQQQVHLLTQIDQLDGALVKRCQALLIEKSPVSVQGMEPFLGYSTIESRKDSEKGKKILAQGECGTLIAAGGQGTRLHFDGPKGMFPVSVIKHKSLFQLFAEKTAAASRQAGCLLSLAIMTSPLNHSAIVQFFEENRYFGLNPQQVSFFSQGMLPFLNEEGQLFLEEVDQIAQGPDGNGSSLFHFVHSGIWEAWHMRGVRYLNYVLIDNPLADPFDATLIGFHASQGSAITTKCCLRADAEEKVGMLATIEGRVHVVEYTEMPESERYAINSEGRLKYPCANLSLFCFTMEQVKDLAYKEMPLHLAYKPCGKTKEQKVWKFEKFIFDLLPLCGHVKALLYPRELCFAPLKNAEGPDSLATVQKALQHSDRIVFETITGVKPSDTPFELSQDFYYPTPELLKEWKGRSLPSES